MQGAQGARNVQNARSVWAARGMRIIRDARRLTAGGGSIAVRARGQGRSAFPQRRQHVRVERARMGALHILVIGGSLKVERPTGLLALPLRLARESGVRSTFVFRTFSPLELPLPSLFLLHFSPFPFILFLFLFFLLCLAFLPFPLRLFLSPFPLSPFSLLLSRASLLFQILHFPRSLFPSLSRFFSHFSLLSLNDV